MRRGGEEAGVYSHPQPTASQLPAELKGAEPPSRAVRVGRNGRSEGGAG